MSGAPQSFGPEWLAAQLAALLPEYPHVRLCVALSGGVDSTVLLTALARHGRRSEPALRAIHIDHGLNPRSREWSRQCRALTRRLGVPIKVFNAKVDRARGVSLEAAARDARYELLRADLGDGEVLLTAHHADDQLETVLLQLLRGAGVSGLAAMPPITPFARGQLARPLLQASRVELETWASEQELTWIDDEMNADEHLDRNYLRHTVLPLVRQRWPGAAHTVSRAARHVAEAQGLLEALARVDVERASDGAALSAKVLRTLSLARRKNAVRFWIARRGDPLPNTNRLDEIVGPLLDARPDANPFVRWPGARLQRHTDRLTLTSEERALQPTAAERGHPEPILWPVRRQRAIELPAQLGKLELEEASRGPIDLDALPAELSVRWRGGGERLRPHRGGPSKSLKNLFQTARIPPDERARVPLLFDAERLLAVGDWWSDVAIQASEHSRRRARFVWHRYLSAG